MIFESILIIGFAIILDLVVGDPRNKYHPTAWIGNFVSNLVPLFKNENPHLEKFGGILIVIISTVVVGVLLIVLNLKLDSIIGNELLAIIVTIVVGAILLKTTIAIRGMEKHALAVVDALENDDIDEARANLAMITKRKTKDLDKNHILSGVLESISENTVDGITGPLFYFALFGLPGAFVYRVINTIDSMIGYKTEMFRNLGWFGANCDNVLNYLPSRLTGLIMVLSSMLLGNDWKQSYEILKKDSDKTSSPNAGYPMAALAGALDTKFQKVDHYTIGTGSIYLSIKHVRSAIVLMKLTTVLFFGIITIPIITVLSYLGLTLLA
ncbi:MAG: cobalamin biosynthesis protein [Candidatus Nitrosopelagicus sp.]|jgi:adenosylcobinamide-phosphate synthase|nr:cobalamin biosynthesis protein [Candidatus Nitrosopelagicus sp.]